MILRKIELENYGPFLNKQELHLGRIGQIKVWKDTLIQKKQSLPLGIIYGPNNSGKSTVLKVLKNLKGLVSGEHIELNKHFEEARSCTCSIYFDDFCFKLSKNFGKLETAFTLTTDKGKVVAEVTSENGFPQGDNRFSPVVEFASRIYFADDSLIYDKDLVKFLADNLEGVRRVLDNTGFEVDDFSLKSFMRTFMGMDENQIIPEGTGRVSNSEHVYYFNMRYSNGREQLLDNASNSLKRFVKLMPLLVSNDKYDVFVIDDVFNSLHTCLLEEIVKFHVFRDDKKQLIFNTNNTHVLNLVEEGGIRRDEIYFIDHRRDGTSSIYSLVDFREDNSKWSKDFERRYLEGRMDATPLIFPTQL